MNKFFAPLLLLPVLGCSVSPSASKVSALGSADLLRGSVMSTENEPGFCAINWTAEKLADVSKAGDMDKPLNIDIAKFKKHAKAQLAKLFGKVGTGKIYYQDMFGRAIIGESNVNLDFARLFYTAPTPPDMKLSADIQISYAASAAGELNIGFAKIGPDFVDFVYPGLVVIYDSEKISKEDFIVRMNEWKKTLAPDLIWNDGEELNPTLMLWAPVRLPLNGNLAQTKQFIDLWKALSADSAVESLELDGEAISGTPTHGKKVLIKDTQKTVDMNALRDISKGMFASEVPFSTLPSLAKPFGIGCKVLNPLVTGEGSAPSEKPATETPGEGGDDIGINF